MQDVLIFFLGGYLVPAVYFGAHVYLTDRGAEDSPSVGESLATALNYAVLWPFAQQMCIPADEMEGTSQ